MGVRVSKAGTSDGKVRTFLHKLYCLKIVAGTCSQHIPLTPASPDLQGTFIDMKGARAAQDRVIDIYYVVLSLILVFDFRWMNILHVFGFWFAMLGDFW